MTPTDFRDCAIAVFLLSLSAPIWLTAAGEIWMWWTWRPLEEEDDSQHRASPPNPNDDAN